MKLLKTLQATKERQQQAFQDTNDELNYVRKNAPTATNLIKKLEQKRDRQETALLATKKDLDLLQAEVNQNQLELDTKNKKA